MGATRAIAARYHRRRDQRRPVRRSSADDAEVGVGRSGGLAGLTPSGRAVVPVAWALYDFANTIFSYAVVSTRSACGSSTTAGSARAGPACSSSRSRSASGINALVSPILGALSDRRRPAAAVPAVLHASCPSSRRRHRADARARRPRPVHVANFAYQAALIYYDATLQTVSYPGRAASCRGSASRRLLRHDLHRVTLTSCSASRDARSSSSSPPRSSGSSRSRSSWSSVSRAGSRPRRVRLDDIASSLGQLRDTIDHARTVPGLRRFLARSVLLLDAVNTIIVVMSDRRVRAMGLTKDQCAPHPARADDRRGRRELRLGAVRRSARPEADADDRPRVVGRRPGPWRRVARVAGTTPGIAMFLLAGAILGSGLGGVQVADRVLMVRLSPPERLGEFFGLYGLVGKGSQVIGQLLYGVDPVPALRRRSASGRTSSRSLSLLVTMLIGLWLVWPVSDRWAGGDECRMAGRMPSRSCRPSGSRRRPRRSSRAASRGPPGSVRVAVRVALAPGPGRADHLVERRTGGRQPRTSRARSADATRTGGSPARRGPDRVRDRPADAGFGRGDHLADREAAAVAEVADEGSSVRGSPGAVASSASRCASARSATWM